MNKWKEILLENPVSRLVRWIFTSIMIILVKIYQYIISPLLPKTCRFYPTCSEYSIEAFRTHGFFKGFVLTIYRISRCHPWGGQGHDPVPRSGDPLFKFKKYKNKK